MDEIHGEKYVSKIDLHWRYHQIQMREEEIHKIAFKCHYRHFDFLVMHFGMTNESTTFQSYMNKVFGK